MCKRKASRLAHAHTAPKCTGSVYTVLVPVVQAKGFKFHSYPYSYNVAIHVHVALALTVITVREDGQFKLLYSKLIG